MTALSRLLNPREGYQPESEVFRPLYEDSARWNQRFFRDLRRRGSSLTPNSLRISCTRLWNSFAKVQYSREPAPAPEFVGLLSSTVGAPLHGASATLTRRRIVVLNNLFGIFLLTSSHTWRLSLERASTIVIAIPKIFKFRLILR